MSKNTQLHGGGQLRSAAIVIYGTLAIAALCIPRSVSDWVEQIDFKQARTVLVPAGNCLRWVSEHSGVDKPFLAARALFLSMTEKEEPGDGAEH